MNISPWHVDIELASPNKKLVAKVISCHEIAMGAPTSGMLLINDQIISMHCSPSIAWSDDSRYIAFPEWTSSKKQQLKILSIETGKIKKLFKRYRVAQLESFESMTIIGLDSPIDKPCKIKIKIKLTNF